LTVLGTDKKKLTHIYLIYSEFLNNGVLFALRIGDDASRGVVERSRPAKLYF